MYATADFALLKHHGARLAIRCEPSVYLAWPKLLQAFGPARFNHVEARHFNHLSGPKYGHSNIPWNRELLDLRML